MLARPLSAFAVVGVVVTGAAAVVELCFSLHAGEMDGRKMLERNGVLQCLVPLGRAGRAQSAGNEGAGAGMANGGAM
jgi:hypothetical protein